MLEVGWWGAIKESFQNILNRGWIKAKAVRTGMGGLKMSSPLPPPVLMTFDAKFWQPFPK